MLKRYCVVFVILVFCTTLVYAEGEAPDEIAAKVNDAVITRTQVSGEVARLMPLSYFHSGVDEEKKAALQKEALNNLIEKELKIQRALSLGLVVKQKVIKKELKEVIARYDNRKAFDDQLKAGNFTIDDVKEEIRKRKLAEMVYQNQVVQSTVLKESDARDYYDKNQDKFIQPFRFHLQNILLKVPPLANDFDREAIQKRGQAVFEKIKEGLAFEEAVQDYSEGKDKDRGGDMGLLHQGRLDPKIEKKILTLKPGEVAGPFLSFRGYYIFKMVEVLPERQSPFDEVKEKLIQELTEKAIREKGKVWMEGLKSKADIIIIEP